MKKLVSILLVLVFVLTSSMAFALGEMKRNDIVLDAVALRPLGFISYRVYLITSYTKKM